MASWHQQRNPVPLYHKTKWTIVTNPPCDMTTLWSEPTEQAAKDRLAIWESNGRDISHSYILPPELDMVPRYAPSKVIIAAAMKLALARSDAAGGMLCPVLEYKVHPAGSHNASPINNDMVAVELVTARGSRWFGCESAHINSELRLVVVGFSRRDEVRSKWEICSTI